MIISHKYRYVYFELPRTGSTTISNELKKHYSGESILHKHATYYEFRKIATDTELTYFTFSNIRNPLDKTVSGFLKLYSYWKERDLSEYNFFVRFILGKKLEFAKSFNENFFSEFFKRFYFFPYDDWSCLNAKTFEYIRFERIQEDFTRVLNLLNIKQIRLLPLINPTLNRQGKDYLSYYQPEIQDKTKFIFGPYMDKWGYEFPPSWNYKPSKLAALLLDFINIFRKYYWRHFYNIHIRKNLEYRHKTPPKNLSLH